MLDGIFEEDEIAFEDPEYGTVLVWGIMHLGQTKNQ